MIYFLELSSLNLFYLSSDRSQVVMATASGDYPSVQFSDELARIAYRQHSYFEQQKKKTQKAKTTAAAAAGGATEKKKKTNVPANFALERHLRGASNYDTFFQPDGVTLTHDNDDDDESNINNNTYSYNCGLHIRYPLERTFQPQIVERCQHEYVKIEEKSMRCADEAVNVISQCKKCNKTVIE